MKTKPKCGIGAERTSMFGRVMTRAGGTADSLGAVAVDVRSSERPDDSASDFMTLPSR